MVILDMISGSCRLGTSRFVPGLRFTIIIILITLGIMARSLHSGTNFVELITPSKRTKRINVKFIMIVYFCVKVVVYNRRTLFYVIVLY